MICAVNFLKILRGKGIEFYAGVPDSILKDFCSAIQNSNENINHITASNEGTALGMAIGHHLATGKVPVVYLQNSGIGNLINPLCSLATPEVYGIPVLFIIGWRGEINTNGVQQDDEPQHLKQGQITLPLMDVLGVPYIVISKYDDISKQIDHLLRTALNDSRPVAIIVRKDTFKNDKSEPKNTLRKNFMSREEAIACCLDTLPKETPIVSTTGMLSRELFELRENRLQSHERDFLTVGGMGHASQIALGISISKPFLKIVCLDGDGAALMHMGGLLNSSKSNIIHILINNGAHDSVGGQPTMAASLNMARIASSCGYIATKTIKTKSELKACLMDANNSLGSTFIEVLCRTGSRSNLGRPTTTPKENKKLYMSFLNSD